VIYFRRSVAVLSKKQLSGAPLAGGLPEPHATFSTLAEFDNCVNDMLLAWLESMAPKSIAPSGAATA
jgi:hypothetical protein